MFRGVNQFYDKVLEQGEVVYINRQGEVVSHSLTRNKAFQWLIPRNVHPRAIHRPGVGNILTNFLNRSLAD